MRKIILYGVILFQLALIVSLIRGIQLSRKSVSRIERLQESKQKLEEERDRLQKKSEYVQSEYYLEKVAREELHLSKPGETVVIIPQEISQEEPDTKMKTIDAPLPNWSKWLKVLSGRI